MSQAGPINIIENNPSIPTQFNTNTGFATPLGNILNVVGDAAQGVSTNGAGNTVTITVANATTSSKGVAQFNPASFSVVGGVVSFIGGGGFVTSVSGTPNRITSTGGTTPVIDIAATYVGQTSITTVGTITTGTWNATAIGPTFGGTGQTSYITGDTLYASAANTLSKLPIGTAGQVLTVAGGIPSWATPTTGTVTSVSGTLNRITSTGGATPVIDIAATYVGQTSITTLGTITTGVWNGTTIATTSGGTGLTTYATGDILYASAPNVLSKLPAATNGQVLTLAAGIPSWATPTTGTVNSVSGTANRITSTGGANPVIDIAATYVGQTSITTLGTITTGVWNASLIPLAFGGTNANLTASNGGIFYSTATAGAILAGTATARQMLQSGASTTPAWSTTTWPATSTINQILYSSAANTISEITAVNNGTLITSATGVPSLLANGTTGQVLTATTGSPPSWATPASGGISTVVSQVFTASGTYTPTAGMKYCIVEVVGGGGGGGATNFNGTTTSWASGGGGAGGYSKKVISAATIGASQTVTVGAAGAGGAAGVNNGSAGGTTSLGALLQATGGAGGIAATTFNIWVQLGGAGGVGSVGNVNTVGAPGGVGQVFSSSVAMGGFGGNTYFGGGASPTYQGAAGNSAVGNAATSYGGGGGGASNYNTNTPRAGGNGFAGIVIITEFI